MIKLVIITLVVTLVVMQTLAFCKAAKDDYNVIEQSKNEK